MIIFQDRLGTNIGKTQKRLPFCAPELVRPRSGPDLGALADHARAVGRGVAWRGDGPGADDHEGRYTCEARRSRGSLQGTGRPHSERGQGRRWAWSAATVAFPRWRGVTVSLRVAEPPDADRGGDDGLRAY
jgi:hypothetical protein